MSEQLRIALYHNLPPGGAKRSLLEMVRRLATRHRIDLFTLSCTDRAFCNVGPYVDNVFVHPFQAWPSDLIDDPLGRLNKGVEMGNMLRLRRLCRRIAREIDDGSYDVAFFHHCRFTQSPSVLAFLETPSVYYCQESVRWIHEPLIPRPYWQGTRLKRYVDQVDALYKAYVATLKRVDRVNTQHATHVLVNSYFTRESIYRIYGINAHVCYLGVDTSHFKPRDVPKEDIVLAVGAVTPAKGYDLIVQGLAHLPQAIRPPMVLVSHAHNVAEREYLKKLAADRGVTLDFRDLGQNGHLVKLYSAARMTAYTPYLEPLGLVPLESMACGTPVIGVREGGVRETVLHGETGLLVDRDAEDFGRAVQTLMTEKKMAQRYGAQGMAYVKQHWSWDHTAQKAEQYLMAAASGVRGGGEGGR